MSDVRIPIKTWLRAATYRRLSAIARAYNVPDVGTLLERLAERAVSAPAPATRRAYVRVTPELRARIRQLQADGLTRAQIAAELGLSVSSVKNHTRGDR